MRKFDNSSCLKLNGIVAKLGSECAEVQFGPHCMFGIRGNISGYFLLQLNNTFAIASCRQFYLLFQLCSNAIIRNRLRSGSRYMCQFCSKIHVLQNNRNYENGSYFIYLNEVTWRYDRV